MDMIAFLWCHFTDVRNWESTDVGKSLTLIDLLVGSGSFAFHSTLKCKSPGDLKVWLLILGTDPMQLLDELSMIYTATIMCYATFSFSQSRLVRQFLGAGLLSLAVFITVWFSYPKGPDICMLTFLLPALLPLPPRSRLPPKCLRTSPNRYNGSEYICDGSKYSTFLEGEIWHKVPNRS